MLRELNLLETTATDFPGKVHNFDERVSLSGIVSWSDLVGFVGFCVDLDFELGWCSYLVGFCVQRVLHYVLTMVLFCGRVLEGAVPEGVRVPAYGVWTPRRNNSDKGVAHVTVALALELAGCRVESSRAKSWRCGVASCGAGGRSLGGFSWALASCGLGGGSSGGERDNEPESSLVCCELHDNLVFHHESQDADVALGGDYTGTSQGAGARDGADSLHFELDVSSRRG